MQQTKHVHIMNFAEETLPDIICFGLEDHTSSAEFKNGVVCLVPINLCSCHGQYLCSRSLDFSQIQNEENKSWRWFARQLWKVLY